ncbi:AzlD domain-containing protein [Endozoicomonadaceae bacterium StTr2]
MLIMIAGMALSTFVIRFFFIALAGRQRLPEPVAQALAFSPAVVLSAIVVTTLSGMAKEATDFESVIPALLSIAVAIAITFLRKNLLLAIGAGMAVYGLLNYHMMG